MGRSGRSRAAGRSTADEWLGGADAGMQLNLQGMEQSKQASASHCGQDDAGVLRCDDPDAQFNVALGSTVWYNKNAGGASMVRETLTGGVASEAARRHGRPRGRRRR